VTWFWILTLQWDKGGCAGLTTQTVEGTMTAGQAARAKTRSAAYSSALAGARQHLGIPGGEPFSVLFFSLERDTLQGDQDD
jgi:hypothetical protein